MDSGCFGYLELFRIILGCLNVLQMGDVFDFLDYYEHLGFFETEYLLDDKYMVM